MRGPIEIDTNFSIWDGWTNSALFQMPNRDAFLHVKSIRDPNVRYKLRHETGDAFVSEAVDAVLIGPTLNNDWVEPRTILPLDKSPTGRLGNLEAAECRERRHTDQDRMRLGPNLRGIDHDRRTADPFAQCRNVREKAAQDKVHDLDTQKLGLLSRLGDRNHSGRNRIDKTHIGLKRSQKAIDLAIVDTLPLPSRGKTGTVGYGKQKALVE